DELREAWRQNPQCNVGIALGPVSGLVRIDVEGDAGENRLQELSGGDLPPTLEFTSGRASGGRGLLYTIPADVTLRPTAGKHGEHQEVRFQAKGAQTVLPPSRHASGRRYEWKPGHGPDEIELALAPRWLIEQLADGTRRKVTNATPLFDRISKGSRDDT